MIASRSDGYSRYSHTNSKRSMFHSLTRLGDLCRKTTSCWRRRRFSASSRVMKRSMVVFSFLPVLRHGSFNPEGYIALSLFPHLSVLAPAARNMSQVLRLAVGVCRSFQPA